MLRPKSIRWFDRLYFAELALSVAGSGYSFFAAPSHNAYVIANWACWVALIYVVSLLIWFNISRRGRNAAKWWRVTVMIFNLAILPRSISAIRQETFVEFRMAHLGLIWVLGLAATVMLFRPDAKAWFAAKGKPVDPSIFD